MDELKCSDSKCTEIAKIERNARDIQDMWKLLESLKDSINYRLPLWATFLIAGLSSACTGLIVKGM